MTTVTPTPVAVRSALRMVPLALVWLAALWPVGLWLVHQQDPELAVRTAQLAGTIATKTALAFGALVLLALIAFPPFPAWLRLAGSRAMASLGNDRGPLMKALADLRHFESAARHLEAGRLALQRGELAPAATHLSRAVELDGSLAGAHHQFGLLLFRVGQLPAAIAAFSRAEQLDPGHAFGDAMLIAGRCAYVLGDTASALRLLNEHERRHGGSRRSHFWLGQARLASGDLDGAKAAFTYAAVPSKQRLTAEENWFRALAKVRLWRIRSRP